MPTPTDAILDALVGVPGTGLIVEPEPRVLADLDALDALLNDAGKIRAIVLREALGRLAEPEPMLRHLSEYSLAHDRLPLVVMEPNAGYHARAISLLIGQPQIGATRLFTGPDLAALLGESGWHLAARHDVVQSEPALGEPEALALGPTLVGDALRFVGRVFNPDTAVSQFVWLLTPTASEPLPTPPLSTPPEAAPRPLVSILLRTQGARIELMTEALYSVFAQTCDDYEVLVCFHDPEGRLGERRLAVEQVITKLPEPLPSRVRLIECREPGRSSPLNALVENARGVYASFLDDDDLLFDHHVETIRQGVEEHGSQALFQTFAAQRLLDPVPSATMPAPVPAPVDGQTQTYPYSVVGMAVPWARPLDPVYQHHENMAPICCLAVPLSLIRQTHLRFRTDLEVGEEWAFWMDALQLLRVVTLPEITAAINHWNDTASNAMLRPDLAPLWRAIRDGRHAAAGDTPLLLDGRARALLAEAGRQSEELVWLRQQLKEREARLAAIQKSRLWRLARAVWSVRDWLQDARRRPR